MIKRKVCIKAQTRKQNLRAYYKAGELIVKNRVDSAGHNFKLNIVNLGVFADGHQLVPAKSDTAIEVASNVIRINRGVYTEEFKNSEHGIRQNFIIPAAPAKTRSLQVKLAVSGMNVRNEGQDKLTFHNKEARGRERQLLTYDSLACWDANGKKLVAAMTYQNGAIHIDVDAAGAAYPVTIDPIIQNGSVKDADAVVAGDQVGDDLAGPLQVPGI